MALSNSERQRKYRQRALHDSDGLTLTRLQVYLRSDVQSKLEKLVTRSGRTKQELINQAISDFVDIVDCYYYK